MGQDTLTVLNTHEYNISDQNCLTRYNSEHIGGETGPDDQNIFGHTDVLINDIFFCERQYLYVLRQ